MMNIDLPLLETAVSRAVEALGDGLVALDIWERETGLTLAGANSHPTAAALINKVTDDLVLALYDSGFPDLQRYFVVDLRDARSLVVVVHSRDVLSGLLLDSARTSLGFVLGVVMPQLLADVAAAGV